MNNKCSSLLSYLSSPLKLKFLKLRTVSLFTLMDSPGPALEDTVICIISDPSVALLGQLGDRAVQ